MGTVVLEIIVVGSCLTLAFLLSGMEAGVLALSRFRVRRQMSLGSRAARLLHNYLEDPENFLWTILVGNTLATYAAFSLLVVALFDTFNGRLWPVAGVFLAVIFLFYTFCDLLPKMLFRQFPNRLCLALALPFRLLHLVLSPLVAVLTWFSNTLLRLTGRKPFKGHIFSSRREMRMALQESAQILTSEERAMVSRVLDLQDLTVRSIVVPPNRMVSVTTQTSVRELLEVCRQHPVNRLPVWHGEGASRRMVGIVSLSAVLYAEDVNPEHKVGRYARAPLQLREDVRLEEALRRMQRSRQRMAVVLGFDQRELGIVNLRDILKSIFGEVTL
jgi:CBS domain containing-hemolysin-like protein